MMMEKLLMKTHFKFCSTSATMMQRPNRWQSANKKPEFGNFLRSIVTLFDQLIAYEPNGNNGLSNASRIPTKATRAAPVPMHLSSRMHMHFLDHNQVGL